MKNLVSIFLLILLLSCDGRSGSKNSNTSANYLENFSFAVDTVVVDVGEELFVPGSYYLKDLSRDLSRGYFFYPENEIHEVDLNSFKLVKRHVFSEDGPDAIPHYLSYMQSLPDGEVFLANYAQMGVYKITGEKVTGYKLQPEEIEGIPDDAAYSLTNSVYISPDKSTIVSLPNTFGEPIEGLAVVNTGQMSAKILDLPALELTKNYQIVFRDGNSASATGDFQRIQFLNDKFLIYSGSTSEIYSYDWRTDSLRLHSFPHQLVPLSKTGEPITNPDSRESQREASRALKKQITYGEFMWDEKREIYLRFANMNWQYDDAGKFVNANIYLFSYDKELNLTGEIEVEELKFAPFGSFIKDGKLYSESVKGENPAFIVYTFDI